jgi:hypothetical protein
MISCVSAKTIGLSAVEEIKKKFGTKKKGEKTETAVRKCKEAEPI